jgi:pimeloyl-ACP methyl ester carboxylesterase
MSTEKSPISFFLLRGLAREVRHWGNFCKELEAANSRFRVIPLEIPGAGRRRAERSPANIADYVDELRHQYLQRIQPEHTNIVLGLSFGAMISARWIYDLPTDFHGAIFINTSGRPSPFYERMRVSAAVGLLRALFYKNPNDREKTLARLICNLADTEILANEWGRIAESTPMAPSNILRQFYAAARFSMPPASTLPTLILYSTNDRLVNSACSQSIADWWQIEPVSHPTAGHDLTTDDPHWCINQIISWLSTVHP